MPDQQTIRIAAAAHRPASPPAASPPTSSTTCCAAAGRSTTSWSRSASRLALADRDRALVRSSSQPCCAGSAPCGICSAASSNAGFPPMRRASKTVLLIGAAQILFLDVPDHAAVDLAVRLAQADRRAAHYSGLINAVLRRVAREARPDSPSSTSRCSTRPHWLMAALDAHYGDETARAIAMAHAPRAAARSHGEGAIRKLGGSACAAACCRPARVRTVAHGPISLLPGYADGAWWVQDAAAALPARLLGDIARQARRRPLRRARRQDRAARAAGAQVHRGRPLGQRGWSALRENLARLRPHGRDRRGRRRRMAGAARSTPCCSTRPARRPARSAAIPTSPGSRARTTSRKLVGLQRRLLDRAVDAAQARRPARLLHLLARSPRKASSRSQALLAPRAGVCAASRSRPTRSAASPNASRRRATCARCPATGLDADTAHGRARRLLRRPAGAELTGLVARPVGSPFHAFAIP